MPTLQLFPTLVHRARLQPAHHPLNARLLAECLQLRMDDAAGRSWSARNYGHGYTSYGSASRMQQRSPTFAALERIVDAHVARFARQAAFDLQGRRLAMTDCWVNIMGRGATHGLHLHPQSAVSGTYYVRTPPRSPGLKLEDPRLDKFMASPPRRATAPRARRSWVTLAVQTGDVLLFESWLRHEVPAHAGARERISVSFNYAWA